MCVGCADLCVFIDQNVDMIRSSRDNDDDSGSVAAGVIRNNLSRHSYSMLILLNRTIHLV